MANIIVIGAGASGMVSAIYASKYGNKVTLIEKNSILGKKILITGNGKCNYWNEDLSLNHYHSTNHNLINNVIAKENMEEISLFFDKLGIIPKIKDGYYYPYSNQATSIQTALIKEIELNHINVLTNIEVIDIKKENNKFIIKTSKQTLTSDKVILATGSYAAPKTGSNGIGYEILMNLGHHIITPLPALVQLQANEPYLKEWHGIRSDVEVSLIENGQFVATEIGEIQLTNYGLSGICIFQLSGRVSRGLSMKKQEQIKINFLFPFKVDSVNKFIIFMNNRNNLIKQRSISDLLDGLLNYKLINLILKLSKIKREDSWTNLTFSQKQVLGNYLTNFLIKITGTNSYDNAQTCTGGLSLTEINLHTMESLKIKNLYITGELLDIDGDCGGYNLSIAWITGMLAGKGVNHD